MAGNCNVILTHLDVDKTGKAYFNRASRKFNKLYINICSIAITLKKIKGQRWVLILDKPQFSTVK